MEATEKIRSANDDRLAGSRATTAARSRGWLLILSVAILLGGLPVAVWLDLRNLAESALRVQASELNSIIASVRAYYTSNVVGRILGASGKTPIVHNYMDVPG